MTITLAGAEEPREPRRFPGDFEGLEFHLGQNSYRQYMTTLREKKQELGTIKDHVDRITGRWSGILSLFRKADKADLRQLVGQEICVLGNISDTLDNMTQLYGGEREHLLAYFALLEQHLEHNQKHKPEALIPIARPQGALALVRSIKNEMHNGMQIIMGHRQAVNEQTLQRYAENSVALMNRCQQAYGTFVLIGDQMRHAYEHLQATGPALVSLIELNEARKVVSISVGNVKSITDTMCSTVDRGYTQLTDFMHHNRVPYLDHKTKRIDFLQK